MKRARLLTGAGLGGFALFIWLRDRGWMTTASDTLPVLAALPLFCWLGGPWHWRTAPPARLGMAVPMAAAAGAAAGTLLDLTALLALAWCGLLYTWLEYFAVSFPRRLLPLPFLAFPWLAEDAQGLGWLFRLTGAGAADLFFRLLGFHVRRAGTLLSIQGMPLSVDPACAGLNVLQALLIAGVVITFLRIAPGPRYVLALLVLAPLAWLANAIRIIALGVSGLSFGAEFAMGWFHQWGGWLVLCVMFLLCQSLLGLLARPRPAP